MVVKERLLAITELNIAGKMAYMDDERFEIYDQSLQAFVEEYKEHKKALKAALDSRDVSGIVDGLRVVWNMLRKIFADELADESQRIINVMRLERLDVDAVGEDIANLISAAAELSKKIRMADGSVDPETGRSFGKEFSGKEKLILAVDDTAIFLNTLKMIFQGIYNCKLTCVTSGSSALKFLSHTRPDLFILDIDMPDMDGYTLARKIRNFGHTAPIIFLTGYSGREHVIRAIMLGGSDFIVKPVNKEQLLSKIKKFL